MVRRNVLINLNSLEDWKSRAWWRARIVRYYFPLGLSLAVSVGLAWPEPGSTVSSHKALAAAVLDIAIASGQSAGVHAWRWSVQVGNHRISNLVLFGIIFVIAGLTFQPEQAWQVLRRPAGFLFGVLTTLAITPMLSFALVRIPFDDPTYATGLGVFFATPTTLSVCSAFVISAGGNGALALMIALASNFLGVATVPWILRAVFERTVVALREPMAKFLAYHVAVPLAAGSALQLIGPKARGFADKRFTEMALISNACIMLVLWTTCSRSKDSLRSATARDIVVILFVSLAAHAFFLAVNFLCARYVLRLSRKHLIAVVIAGSEKTLGVSAALAGSLRPEIFGESPLLVAPGLIAHLCQLLMDSLVTVIINAFKSDVPRGRAQAAAPAPDVQEGRVDATELSSAAVLALRIPGAHNSTLSDAAVPS